MKKAQLYYVTAAVLACVGLIRPATAAPTYVTQSVPPPPPCTVTITQGFIPGPNFIATLQPPYSGADFIPYGGDTGNTCANALAQIGMQALLMANNAGCGLPITVDYVGFDASTVCGGPITP